MAVADGKGGASEDRGSGNNGVGGSSFALQACRRAQKDGSGSVDLEFDEEEDQIFTLVNRVKSHKECRSSSAADRTQKPEFLNQQDQHMDAENVQDEKMCWSQPHPQSACLAKRSAGSNLKHHFCPNVTKDLSQSKDESPAHLQVVALGRPSVSSIHSPQPLLEVEPQSSSVGDILDQKSYLKTLEQEPIAAESTMNLVKSISSCIHGMDLNALSACLAAVVYSSAQPPVSPLGSSAGDGASVIIKSVLDRATELLTDHDTAISCSIPSRNMWQASSDSFFGLLMKCRLSTYDRIMQSLKMQAPNAAVIGGLSSISLSCDSRFAGSFFLLLATVNLLLTRERVLIKLNFSNLFIVTFSYQLIGNRLLM
ncbi:hypothetical protein OPV22_001322 [Ensete ventricosum]|uniref:Uncharacterized protein n=1 Tax=Ensete ventricosum TaxID=4639 RepID=A0AAV8RTA5_ENSVE|nr:hypothetical protein OPV22_001322 [Ensete ventricosum]